MSIVSAADSNPKDIDIHDEIQIDDNTNNFIKEESFDKISKETSISKNEKNIKQDSNMIILNSTTFDDYVTDKQLNENVKNGDTIDIQGLLDGYRFSIEINKPVNIISSTRDAFFTNDMNSGITENIINTFVISFNGSGTNMSGITFHNTHIYTTNAHNITINNITASCNAMIGMGRGMFSIRDGSSNVNITNSYFETFPNGGHSNVVFAYAHDCIFENNTVKGHGGVGNLVYITTYGSSEDTGQTNVTYGNTNITIRNNYIDGSNATDSGICVGIVVEGANHTIVNNTILKTIPYMIQVNDYGTNTANITFEDNYCPLSEKNIINITDKNYDTYGTINKDVFELNEITNNTYLNINTTIINEVYSDYSFNLMAINPTINKITLNYENIEVNNLYAPDTIVILKKQAIITNSTLKAIIAENSQTSILNNIIVNDGKLLENYFTSILLKQSNNQTILKNNYLLAYNEDNVICGENAITKISGNNEIIENNTPHYSNTHILNMTTYSKLFNEDNTLKGNVTGTIILTESLNQPIIINKKINLTSQKIPDVDKELRGINWGKMTSTSNTCYIYPIVYRKTYRYNDVIFISGSEQSNLTNTYIKNIIINNTTVNIKNNNINGTINIINSSKNNIKENNVTTNNNYTINIDKTSTENLITNNTLISGISKGDISVQYTGNNIVKNNLPLADVDINIKTNSTRTVEIHNTSTQSQYVEHDIFSIGIPYELQINVTSYGKAVKNGYVLLLSNGTPMGEYRLENGFIKTNISISDYNHENLKVWYYPDEIYQKTSSIKPIKLLVKNSNTTITAEKVKIGEIITIHASVMDEFGNSIQNGILTFIINSTEHNTTITEGNAIFIARTNESWINGVKAKYYETSEYNESTSNIIKLEKGDVLFYIKQKIEGENLKISVNVTDIGNIPVSTGYVRFKINKTTNIPINNGNAEYEIALANITEGQEISITFTSNPAFNTKTENITLSLDPPTITQIQIEDIVGKINQPTVITATVTAEDGITVNEGSVTFTTTDYTETVNIIEGVAQTTHTFTQSLIDTLQAIYIPITSNYYECTNTCTIIISKDPENVTINLNAITGRINEEVTLTATVMTTDNMQVIYGSVTFTTINFNETVNIIDGTATTTHIFTDEMDELLTAMFIPANPDDYNPSSNTTTITIKGIEYSLKVDTTTFTLLEPNNITASIYYGDNLARNISKGKVTFKVNGKTLKDSNGKVIYVKIVNGTATIENYMISDTWNKQTTIQAVYSGSVDVESLKSEKENITITKAAPTITLSDVIATQGQSIEINIQVTLLQNPVNTGKLIIKINGKTIKDANGKVIFATVTNGMATILYTIPESMKAKDYPLTAIFTSTDYERVEATKTLNVLRD